jgi:hypothetical protein
VILRSLSGSVHDLILKAKQYDYLTKRYSTEEPKIHPFKGEMKMKTRVLVIFLAVTVGFASAQYGMEPGAVPPT